jgi:MFS family permease
VALVMLGLSVANVVGVPAATWLGQNLGWRSAYWLVAVLGLATIALVRAFVPYLPADPAARGRRELAVFADWQVWLTLLAGLTLALSHVGSLWLNWYDGGERWRVSAATAMWQPYPRMLVLHVAIILGFGLVLRSVGTADGASGLEELAPVLLLLGLKTVVDLALHLWERRRAAAPVPVAAE